MNDTRYMQVDYKYDIPLLRRYRIIYRVSLNKLSKLSGIPLKQLGEYDSGDRELNELPRELIEKLASFLNCNPEDLVK